MVRPATQTGRATSLEGALKTPRTARSARPVTSHAARTIRLGTASMMTQPDGPFIQVLNRSTFYCIEEGQITLTKLEKRKSSLCRLSQ
ncbi:unnamed protein product, partial [Nesidiocoris tenuis]